MFDFSANSTINDIETTLLVNAYRDYVSIRKGEKNQNHFHLRRRSSTSNVVASVGQEIKKPGFASSEIKEVKTGLASKELKEQIHDLTTTKYLNTIEQIRDEIPVESVSTKSVCNNLFLYIIDNLQDKGLIENIQYKDNRVLFRLTKKGLQESRNLHTFIEL